MVAQIVLGSPLAQHIIPTPLRYQFFHHFLISSFGYAIHQW